MSKKFRAIMVLAVVGAAVVVAALSGAVGRSSAATHTVTPMTKIGPNNMAVVGQVGEQLGAIDPAGQVGPLRSCQTTGVCYGPDQIRKAYGFDTLYAKGFDGTGRTIVIID